MTAEDRSRPSVEELRRVTQPPEVLGRRDAEHWTAGLYLRRLSPYLTRELLALGASANAVTVAMIVTGVLAGLALVLPGLAGAALALLLGQLQMLLDCADGEVARWRRQQSALGVFLDRLGHYAAELSITVAWGVRAAVAHDEPFLLAAGAALAALVLLNRAVNDMVHAARATSGLPPLPRDEAVAVPRSGGLARLRRLARWFPVHRALHSVELTMLVFAAAVVDALGYPVTGPLLAVAVPVAVLVVVGHVVAVVGSRRLRAA